MDKFGKLTVLFMFLLCMCSVNTFSQYKLNVKVSASNLLRYGTGTENSVTGDKSKEYFEELFNARIFVNEFLVGARYEYDDVIEIGKGVKGFSERFLEFRNDDFTARGGTYYDVVAQGLTFNGFESRPIGFKTQMDGARVNFNHTFGKKQKVKFHGTLFGGGMDYTDVNDTGRTEVYSIGLGNFSVSPFKLLTLGGSYLAASGKLPTGNIITDINAEIYEGNMGLSYKGFDLLLSYANKVTISEPNSIYTQSQAPRGDGAYGSLAYTREGFGITLDYKNYRFNLVTPDQRSATSPFKALPFQVAPTCIKVYSTTLLSRYPHSVDFNDEVGWQVDAFYSPNDKLTFNGNASLTSRHYDYADVDSSIYTKYERIDRGDALLPSTENQFSPYWEFFLGAEYYANDNLLTKIGVSKKTSVLYSQVDPGASDIIKAFTVPFEVQYTFSKVYGVTLVAEIQKAYNSIRTGDKYFWNESAVLSFSRSPDLIVSGILENTSDQEDPSGKKFWMKGELTYKFSSSNVLIVSYGSERGGIQCSSGICRYVNPFNGFRLTLINNYN